MKLGIIGAMQIEIENLKPSIKGAKVEVISGIEFISGKIDGIDVVAAVSGIGKVFAAVCTEIMILHFGVEKVINIGVAGSLVIGDPAGLVSGINVINFDTDPELRNVVVDVLKAREIPYETGVIASGDLFVDTDRQRQNIHLKFNAIAADMEGGAIAHVCYINNIPFALIRSISDADGSAMDYNTFAGKAAEQSIAIVLDVIKKLK